MSHVLTLRCRRVGSQRWKTDNFHNSTDKSEQPGQVDFCWVQDPRLGGSRSNPNPISVPLLIRTARRVSDIPRTSGGTLHDTTKERADSGCNEIRVPYTCRQKMNCGILQGMIFWTKWKEKESEGGHAESRSSGHTAAARDKNGGEKTPSFLLGTEGV